MRKDGTLKPVMEFCQSGAKFTFCPNLSFYTVSQKKGATLTMAVTLSILDGFAKFFHYCKDQ